MNNNIDLLIKASLQSDYNALHQKKCDAIELLMYLENFIKSREFQFITIKFSNGMINHQMLEQTIMNVNIKIYKLHQEITFLNEQLNNIAKQLKNE